MLIGSTSLLCPHGKAHVRFSPAASLVHRSSLFRVEQHQLNRQVDHGFGRDNTTQQGQRLRRASPKTVSRSPASTPPSTSAAVPRDENPTAGMRFSARRLHLKPEAGRTPWIITTGQSEGTLHRPRVKALHV